MEGTKKELQAFEYGQYILSETENPNQFYFLRRDEGVIGDVGRLPIDMYQLYLNKKMYAGEITGRVFNDISFDVSEDGTCIKLTVHELSDKKGTEQQISVSTTEPTFKKRMQSLFGWRRKR